MTLGHQKCSWYLNCSVGLLSSMRRVCAANGGFDQPRLIRSFWLTVTPWGRMPSFPLTSFQSQSLSLCYSRLLGLLKLVDYRKSFCLIAQSNSSANSCDSWWRKQLCNPKWGIMLFNLVMLLRQTSLCSYIRLHRDLGKSPNHKYCISAFGLYLKLCGLKKRGVLYKWNQTIAKIRLLDH